MGVFMCMCMCMCMSMHMRVAVGMVMRVLMGMVAMRSAAGPVRGVGSGVLGGVLGGHGVAPATQSAQRPRSVRSWCCTSKPGGARSFIGPGQAWIG